MIAWSLTLQAGISFNLICSQIMPPDQVPDERYLVLRVDLDAGKFCIDDCRSILPIKSTSKTEIIFQDETTPKGSIVRRVNRETGDYYLLEKASIISMERRGECTVAPFTGFTSTPSE